MIQRCLSTGITLRASFDEVKGMCPTSKNNCETTILSEKKKYVYSDKSIDLHTQKVKLRGIPSGPEKQEQPPICVILFGAKSK